MPLFVIPAEEPGSRVNNLWIPAFAGMTSISKGSFDCALRASLRMTKRVYAKSKFTTVINAKRKTRAPSPIMPISMGENRDRNDFIFGAAG